MGRVRKTKLTLEEYEAFLHNPSDRFTSEQLNQMIFMHGFQKIHKRRKSVLFDALSTIDLMKIERSTLGDDLPPHHSSLSLDQVKQDLEALNWNECSVQSLVTLGPSLCRGGEFFKFGRKRPRSEGRRRRIIPADGSATQRESEAVAEVGCSTGEAQQDDLYRFRGCV